MSKSEAGGQIKETKGRAGKMMEQDKEKREEGEQTDEGSDGTDKCANHFSLFIFSHVCD